jgi:hypothetical protein
MNNALVDFYRCPEDLLDSRCPRSMNSSRQAIFEQPDFESLRDCSRDVDNLRLERYSTQASTNTGKLLDSEVARRLYYRMRPALPGKLRQLLQRVYLRDWRRLQFPRWPVDTSVEDIFEKQLLLAMNVGGLETVPFVWFWPDGAPSAAIMTHDVEASAGLALVPTLMDLDDEFGIKASFQLVPERRYTVSNDLREIIRKRQCEVNVHGLDHDGNLFRDRRTFLKQCNRINHYIEEFGAEGFRSACMYRNVEWFKELNISYDMSVPNVAHLEPQRGGCCTVFPYFIGHVLELPLTTVQDYSLFHVLDDYSMDLWENQITLITKRHGLASFIVHPDYIFAGRPLHVYRSLLAYLSRLRSEKNMWIARPGDVNRWWRERNAMKIVFEDGQWRIQGQGRERARIAFARRKGDGIVYTVAQNCEPPVESEYEHARA